MFWTEFYLSFFVYCHWFVHVGDTSVMYFVDALNDWVVLSVLKIEHAYNLLRLTTYYIHEKPLNTLSEGDNAYFETKNTEGSESIRRDRGSHETQDSSAEDLNY